MNILVGNDDGIAHIGLISLVRELKNRGHNLLVIAPDGNRSAFAHSVNFRKPIKIVKSSTVEGVNSYKITGTPCDCIKIATHLFYDFKPDIIITGINDAQNIGTDTLYSATLSMIIEGSFLGYKGIAFSVTANKNTDFTKLAVKAADVFETLYPISKERCIWNVNFPDVKAEDIKGIKFCSLGRRVYSDAYEQVEKDTFSLDGEIIKDIENDDNSDVRLIEQGYITVTPVIYDRTDYKMLEELNK